MTGKVNDGQLCTVEPLREHVLEVGDIVRACCGSIDLQQFDLEVRGPP